MFRQLAVTEKKKTEMRVDGLTLKAEFRRKKKKLKSTATNTEASDF